MAVNDSGVIVPSEYRNNHYVPIWYQKRFLLPKNEHQELFYLDFKSGTFTDPRGITHDKKAIHRWGCKKCFMQKDLYTSIFGQKLSTRIEKEFFGSIDNKGRRAIDYFTSFEHPSVDGDSYNNMIMYMSTQKLRTPKGLGWLGSQIRNIEQNKLLTAMIHHRHLYCAIWTECIWQIADANNSNTKFIISDHPVTVYNRICGPRSQWCREYNDPDIRCHGTHTIFPLCIDKVLILTNLSWVRNPYRKETDLRPNPRMLRSAIFNFQSIQTQRHLTEQEVLEINFIIKSRALRYIAAAKEEWLFPDRHISKAQWNQYGHGYLLMPDPRPVHVGGELMWGDDKGGYGAQDEYGRRPWEKDYNKETKTFEEAGTLSRFQGEFARLFGPRRRGLSFSHVALDNERDSDDFHQYHLSLEKKFRRHR